MARKVFLGLLFIFSLIIALALHLIRPAPLPAQSVNCVDAITRADQLYLDGNRTGAEALYRQCKPPIAQQNLRTAFPEPLMDPDRLRPASRVYWREAQEGLERNQENRIFTALDLLIQQHPDFVPAYSVLAEALQRFNRETDALATLEEAATLFPYNADIAMARTVALRNARKYLEASMAARLFAIINPDDPQRSEFIRLANDNLEIFKTNTRAQYIGTGILNIVGNIFFGGGSSTDNVISSAQLAATLIDGEEATGAALAATRVEEAQSQNALIEDPVILDYVNTIGQDIATQMGRDEFTYEFNVIASNALNAFAFPGGKIFINTGAILAADTEAELAGLIAHEVAHTVLSHGYQTLASQGLIETASNAIPIRNLAQMTTSSFSRQREQEADILGARAIAGYGYAADGLRNFLLTLSQVSGSGQPEYLSSHPAPPTRIRYLEALIQQNGYNQYGYEGIAVHQRIQQRIRSLLN